MKALFPYNLGAKYVVTFNFNDDDIVVMRKENNHQVEIMTLEDFQEQGIDSRLYDIVTYKEYVNMHSNYCILMIAGQRAELSSFDELQGVFVSLPK